MGVSLCQTTRMSRKKATRAAATRPAGSSNQPVSLKVLAEYLGLSPATISLVINRSPVAGSIPQETKDRIFSAARRFNYRPNFVARSLRKQRSLTIGVVVPEVSEGYAALVMSGIEDHLLQEGYFYFVASHRHRSDLIDEYPKLLLGRSVEGIIAVDTPCDEVRRYAGRQCELCLWKSRWAVYESLSNHQMAGLLRRFAHIERLRALGKARAASASAFEAQIRAAAFG